MRRSVMSLVLVLVFLVGSPTLLWGQGPRNPYSEGAERAGVGPFPTNCFTFCRIQYDSFTSRRRGWGKWRTDFPESDYNFSLRLSQLTSIEVNRYPDGSIRHDIVRLDDPALRHYPFIYMIEVGSIMLSPGEVEGLRNYLLRGGFLMVDDFWGEEEWANWNYEFDRVLPPDEYPRFEIPLDHPIYHIVFDLDEVPQVPALDNYLGRGLTYERPWEPGTDTPHIWGVNDKEGRLMAVICHNTDLGDGWEREGQSPEYFQKFSVKKAYPMGINIVVYAMTH